MLSGRLVTAVLMAHNRAEVKFLLDDLLTATERIMLGKRLLIALLLKHGFSYAEIAGVLRVGETTIAAVSEKMQRGGNGFNFVFERLQRREKLETLFANLLKLLPAIPPKVGPGRWQSLSARPRTTIL